MFGEDNQIAIGAQIKVLKEKYTEDYIYRNRLFHEGDEMGYTQDAAISAARWLAGEGEYETLSEEWEGLCG